MLSIPAEIDGARVILYAAKSYPLNFGDILHENGYRTPIEILVIAQYEDGVDFYVFACDENWRVWGDTVHETLEEAKALVRDFYNEAKDIDWQKP